MSLRASQEVGFSNCKASAGEMSKRFMSTRIHDESGEVTFRLIG